MTPTLFGRWQTRALLFLTEGMFITFFFGLIGAIGGGFLGFIGPFIILLFVMFTGFGWDILYTLLQKLRWDRDWPPAFSFIAGIIEFVPAFILAFLLSQGRAGSIILGIFHYWFVWWVVFWTALGPMRILFPRWRFKGGQWL